MIVAAALLALLADRLLIARDAIQPQLTADRSGRFYCTYLVDGNVFLSRSQDDGKTWSTPVVAIDAKHRAQGGMQRGPRVGVDAHQRVYVSAPLVLGDESVPADAPADLWLAISNDGGNSFAAPIRVNDVAGKAPEALHWLAVADDGTAHLAWLDLRAGKGTQDLFHARCSGGTVSPNVKIADALCSCCAPGLCVDRSGQPRIVFRDGGDDASRKILMISSQDGGATWTKPMRVNTGETRLKSCPMDAPAVAAIDAKHFGVAWMDLRAGLNDRDVHWLTTAIGTLAAEQPLATITKGTQGHPSLCFDAGGELHAAWEDGRDGASRIFYRRSTKLADVAVSTAAEGKAAFPSVACGKVVGVAYETEQGVTFRRVAD